MRIRRGSPVRVILERMRTIRPVGFLLLALCSCAALQRTVTSSPADLKILSRADWSANPPVGVMKSHQPGRITIHHTAMLQNPERSLKDKLQALQDFSQHEGQLGNGKSKPAWPDVPYHFYIDCQGEVAEGRDVNFFGDTNTAYDPTGHVLVVLEGNFEEEPVTDAQWTTLTKLVTWLAARFQLRPADLQGHKDFASKACPGKQLHERLPKVRAVLAAM